jgi:hypothetical protein
LGVALQKQLKYVEASRHLDRAYESATEVGDSIKDEIWREIAACRYAWWHQEAQIRSDKRERLKRRLAEYTHVYYSSNPGVRPDSFRTF